MIVADDFNRPDGSLGANWTQSAHTPDVPTISSHQAIGDAIDEAGAIWNANTFGDRQFARATISSASALPNTFVALILRETDSSHGYVAQFDPRLSAVSIIRYPATTILNVNAITLVVGDLIEFRAIGSLLSLYLNHALIGSDTDSTNASGAIGFAMFGVASGLDDFSGGDFDVPVASPFFAQMGSQMVVQ